MIELPTQNIELLQQIQQNEQYIQNLQKHDYQIQHKQFNIKELFDVEFDDDSIINEKQIKQTNKTISKVITDGILQSNMLNQNLISDIQDVNYNQFYDQKNVNLLETNNSIQFCDNIILFYLLPTQSLKNKKQDLIITQQKNTKLREICKKYDIINNISIDDVKHLRKPQSLNKIESPEKQQVQIILNENQQIMEQYRNVIYNTRFENYLTDISYYVMKIECQNIPFDELIQNFQRAEKELNNEGFYLFQLDITQDFLGNFNKEETIKYLCNNYDFGVQFMNEKKKFTILDNNTAVGDNCLTYITSNYEFLTRHKIYNKFVCQLTSTSVQRKYFNNHLIDMFNSHTYNLKYCLQQSKNYGITRFEITVYNSKLLDANAYKQLIKDQFNLFKKSNIFYFTQLQKQYKSLEQKINQNLIIVDNLTNKIYCGLWSNYLTEQIIGQIVKFTENNKNDKIQDSIRNFSFINKPCYVLQITKIDKQNISVDLQCYIRNSGQMLIQQNYKKNSDQTKNLFLRQDGIAQHLFQNQDNIYKWNIDENINKNVKIYNISQSVDKDIIILKKDQLQKIKKQIKMRKEELLCLYIQKDEQIINKQQELKQSLHQQRYQQEQEIQQLMKYISQKEQEIKQYNDVVFFILSQFKTDHIFFNQLKQNLQNNQIFVFKIIAFKFIENIFYCLDLNKQQVIAIPSSEKYYYKVLQDKMSQFKQFILSKSLRNKLTYKDKKDTYFQFYSTNFEDLQKQRDTFTIEIMKNGQGEMYPYQNKSKQLQTVKYEQTIDIQQYDQQKEQLKILQQKINNIENLEFIQLNTKNALKFEQLNKNTNYIIKSISQFNYVRGRVNKIRYYILIDNQIYISNSFFEKQIKNHYNQEDVQINQFNAVLQTLSEKTTETKNKELNCQITF